MKQKNHNHAILAAMALTAAAGAYCVWENNRIRMTELTLKRTAVPQAFDGFRIVQVSDLHNKNFGEKQQYLLEQIQQAKPDIIAVTGDIVDNTDMKCAELFAQKAVEIAPVYYVAGNHERRYNVYPLLRRKLLEAGVHVLDNETAVIERDGEKISLIGLQDPTFFGRDAGAADRFEEKLAALAGEADTPFRILLSHRPEKFDCYIKYPVSLVFCGHAHGGQVRLPGIPGLFSPQQGIFPQYTSGMYTRNGTTMVVSRGLGTTKKMPRVGNPPELITVTLGTWKEC